MASNYDNSAFFYDRLSKLVFGDALIKAQAYFLAEIPANARVLIIGGGTGFILEEIAKTHPAGLDITYVEISARMMERSRSRNAGKNKVLFVTKAIEEVTIDVLFDVVITPFLFDNYESISLPGLMNHIDSMLKPGGLWLNTDFQLTGHWWQFVLLKSMLLFFKVLCGVESWRLAGVEKQFDESGYLLIKHKSFFKDFVAASAYTKYNLPR